MKLGWDEPTDKHKNNRKIFLILNKLTYIYVYMVIKLRSYNE